MTILAGIEVNYKIQLKKNENTRKIYEEIIKMNKNIINSDFYYQKESANDWYKDLIEINYSSL